jgi:hypothetical protein
MGVLRSFEGPAALVESLFLSNPMEETPLADDRVLQTTATALCQGIRQWIESNELKAIANYGFPIVITAYLLIRMEAKLVRLAVAISDLAKVVAALQSDSSVPVSPEDSKSG